MSSPTTPPPGQFPPPVSRPVSVQFPPPVPPTNFPTSSPPVTRQFPPSSPAGFPLVSRLVSPVSGCVCHTFSERWCHTYVSTECNTDVSTECNTDVSTECSTDVTQTVPQTVLQAVTLMSHAFWDSGWVLFSSAPFCPGLQVAGLGVNLWEGVNL